MLNDLTLIPAESAPVSEHYAAPTCTARGETTSRLIHPEDFSLWVVEASLSAASELMWQPAHGDELLYVLDGTLEADGRRCGPQGAVVIESGVSAVVRAVEDSRIVHFGPVSPASPADGPFGAPDAQAHSVHVIQKEDVDVLASSGPIRTVYYADSTCPTCRITLLRNWSSEPFRSSSHSHSEDELMFLVSGDMHVGSAVAGPRSVIAISGDRRYGFRSETGFDFLNFRADASLYTRGPRDPASLETLEAMTSAGYLRPTER